MREFNRDAQTPKIGFLIGYDFYRYGWHIDRNDDLKHLSTEQLKPVLDGYNEAKHTKTSQHKNPDYFQKKLLHIRARAYRKGIEVSISESDIEQSYHYTKEVCPVIRKPLTFATGEDTDFSVDRVDNDKGYIPGNIFVMSSYANQAKDDVSLEELMLYASSKDADMTNYDLYPKFVEMQPEEWVRLYFWMAGFMTDELVDKTTYRIVKEHKQFSFVTEAFYFFLFLVYAAQPKKAFQKELLESKIINTYTGSSVLNDRQRTRLRKSAVKHATRHFQIMSKSHGMVNTVNSFIQLKSIQDIKVILDRQIEADLLAEDGTKRILLIKELYHRKYREQVIKTNT